MSLPMFRNRTNSQKPTEELYASFKQTFPEVGPGTTSSSAEPTQSSTSLGDALTDAAMNNRQLDERDEDRDHEPTPRGMNEAWRFTPSLLDTNSFAFASFANQPPGYYTPTPGGINTLYHSQAGDLHAPGMGFQLGTPLSLSTSEGPMHAASSMDMHHFHSNMFQADPFQDSTPYAQQQTFAPSSFVHQDSGYGAIEGSPGNEISMDTEISNSGHIVALEAQDFKSGMAVPMLPPAEKFRFHVTLNAPTAMIRHADEIPVTYLNKGQAYSVSIVDTMPFAQTLSPVKYRTFVRISFEDEQQRQRPAACWQLWKEGRGLAEAHQRAGKLQAVEYVDSNQQSGESDSKRPRIELDCASFDSFAVIWTTAPGAATADCTVAVRFNFLSTDFSHSKGVKGIPVRFCAKTEIFSSDTPDSTAASPPEVCFCKVKLFRDHGAERKLSNDVAHVKKTIDKLKQQITQVESGVREFGKRKRTGSVAGKSGGERPGKVQKHKRTWSISSQNSSGRPALEEDLHAKLATIQDMFTSTRPASVLYLKGLEQDDPDLYPVSLPGQPQDLTKIDTGTRRTSWEQKHSAESTPTNSLVVSPASSHSVPSLSRSKGKPAFQKPASLALKRQPSNDWAPSATFSGIQDTGPIFDEPEIPSHATKVYKNVTDCTLPAWIEALGVDTTYKPPPERPIKPVACFYVLIKVCGRNSKDDYYRAVYLMQRTVEDLIQSIAAKCEVDVNRIHRVIRVNAKGLKIMIDDELVRELPEGQDMAVDFDEINSEPYIKNEPNTISEDQFSSSEYFSESTSTKALEMRLIF